MTAQIIGAAFEVFKELGYGFLEKVYQRAMVVELGLRGLTVTCEPSSHVFFKNVCVGDYAADLLVEGKVIVELKVAGDLNPADLAQLINELHALRYEVGLPINFGRTGVKFKRAANLQSLPHDKQCQQENQSVKSAKSVASPHQKQSVPIRAM